MRSRLGTTLCGMIALGWSMAAGAAADYDSNPAWPLCGSYYENPPTTWDPVTDGCPSSRYGMPDLINDTYGPRLRSGDYDWHRGLDLHTGGEDGRPVFAITCGKTKKVEDQYNGEVIIEHYPDHECQDDDTLASFPKCHKVGGCYYSRYQHLKDAVVTNGTLVQKGQLIGYSGRNVDSTTDPAWSGAYPHVHFEIRDYPGGPDYYARGQREAIHPLKVLPYDNGSGADGIVLTITDVDTGDPGHTTVTVQATLANDGEELDLVRVDLAFYVDGTEVPWTNPGASYTTPDGDAYVLDPPFFDMQLWSRQYNYTDTTKVPYEDFLAAEDRSDGQDGQWLSPYADGGSSYHQALFPTSYDADWHLEAKSSAGDDVGDFNGVEVAPDDFNRTYDFYVLELTFDTLPGVAPGAGVCVKAWATDARGSTTDPDDAVSSGCPATP